MPKAFNKKNNEPFAEQGNNGVEATENKKSFAQRLGEKLRKFADNMDEKDSASSSLDQANNSFSYNDSMTDDFGGGFDNSMTDDFGGGFDNSMTDDFGGGFNNSMTDDFSGGFDNSMTDDFSGGFDNSMTDDFSGGFNDIQSIPSENDVFGATPYYDENLSDSAEQTDNSLADEIKPSKRRPRDLMGSLLHRLKHEYDDDRKKLDTSNNSDELENSKPTDYSQPSPPIDVYTAEPQAFVEPNYTNDSLSQEISSALDELDEAYSQKNEEGSYIEKKHRYQVDYTSSEERKKAELRAKGITTDEPKIFTDLKRFIHDFISRLPSFKVKEYVPHYSDNVTIDEDSFPAPSLMADIERYVENRRDLGVVTEEYENARSNIQNVQVNSAEIVRRNTTPENAFEVYNAGTELMSMIEQISFDNERQRMQIGVYQKPEEEDPYNYRGINSNRIISEEENQFDSFDIKPVMSFESENRVSPSRADLERQYDVTAQPQYNAFNTPPMPEQIGNSYAPQASEDLSDFDDDFDYLNSDNDMDFSDMPNDDFENMLDSSYEISDKKEKNSRFSFRKRAK